MTFRSKVLSRTSLEKPLFLAILAYFTTSEPVFFDRNGQKALLTEIVKKHIYGLRPFIWVYNQVLMTFRSKVLARTKKYDGQTDRRTLGQTDGHPKPIGPQPFGLGPKNDMCIYLLFFNKMFRYFHLVHDRSILQQSRSCETTFLLRQSDTFGYNVINEAFKYP